MNMYRNMTNEEFKHHDHEIEQISIDNKYTHTRDNDSNKLTRVQGDVAGSFRLSPYTPLPLTIVYLAYFRAPSA